MHKCEKFVSSSLNASDLNVFYSSIVLCNIKTNAPLFSLKR